MFWGAPPITLGFYLVKNLKKVCGNLSLIGCIKLVTYTCTMYWRGWVVNKLTIRSTSEILNMIFWAINYICILKSLKKKNPRYFRFESLKYFYIFTQSSSCIYRRLIQSKNGHDLPFLLKKTFPKCFSIHVFSGPWSRLRWGRRRSL